MLTHSFSPPDYICVLSPPLKLNAHPNDQEIFPNLLVTPYVPPFSACAVIFRSFLFLLREPHHHPLLFPPTPISQPLRALDDIQLQVFHFFSLSFRTFVFPITATSRTLLTPLTFLFFVTLPFSLLGESVAFYLSTLQVDAGHSSPQRRITTTWRFFFPPRNV